MSGLKSSRPYPSDDFYFGASGASLQKGFWAMALHGTAPSHGDFAVEDVVSRWHLFGDGALCWETALVCGRLNLRDGEQSRAKKGILQEERMILWGERMLRVFLGGKALLCFTTGPEIIPGGHSAMRSPWEQGSPGPVMLAPPKLGDGLKCGGMRTAYHVMTRSQVGMPLRPSRTCREDALVWE